MKILVTFIVTLVCSYMIIPHTLPKPQVFNITVEKVIVVDNTTPQVKQVSITDLMISDMIKYKYLNDEFRYELANLIVENANKFNIDPKLLYAFIKTESAFNVKAIHKPTRVKALNYKKIQAIGLGGVVWEFWGDELVTNTSIQKKSELRDYRKNIEATAYIISELSNKKKHRLAKNDIDTIAIWYYGRYSYDYISKINYNHSILDI